MLFRTELDIFKKKGPYTFEEALRLAKQSRDCEEDLAAALDDCSWKFPLPEFAKLLNPLEYCDEDEYDDWLRGTNSWTLSNTTGKFSDEQLELVATKQCGFVSFIRVEKMDRDHKLQVLKIHNLSVRRREKQKYTRDASPVRE